MNPINGFSRINEATAGEISDNSKVISHGKKTYRLIYKNPLNHNLLNFAASQKPPGNSKYYVPLKFNLENGAETVWVNINSIAKRLGIKKKEVLAQSQQPNFDQYLQEQIKAKEVKIEEEFATRAEIPHSATGSKESIRSLKTSIMGFLSDIAWVFVCGAIKLPHLRSLVSLNSTQLEDLSKARAIKEFHRAADKVPAYQDFLKKNTTATPKTFDEIPVTDKENYIKPNTLESTLVGGKLPKGGQIDTSTGTTGKPTVWVRSAEEREFNRLIIDQVRKELIGDALFINAYALGGLSTGLTAHTAIVDKNLLISTGPDCEKVLDMIEKFGHDGKQLVISGYPSFMSTLLDAAEKRGIHLKNYNLISVVGGEGISETLRDRLTDHPGGFKKVISGYGASDLDINIGFETDICVALRKECIKNPALAKEFFGDKSGSPMIFNYNPLLYYVETDSNSNLLYTSVSGEKVSPRVRYNSHDVGITMKCDELKKKLKMFNIDFELPKIDLPFLFVWGREGLAASYYAAKVIPEELERAIQNIPELKDQVENYALHSYEDEKGELKLDFMIELKPDAKVDLSPEVLNGKILEQIRKHSMDFTRMDDIAITNGTERPALRLFPAGQGPMANQPAHVKKKFIYKGKL